MSAGRSRRRGGATRPRRRGQGWRLAAAAALAGALLLAAPTSAQEVGRATPPGPLAPPTRVAPATQRVTLANGLRLVVVEHHRRPIVEVRLVFPQGALGEPERSAGATWLALHLATDYRERADAADEADVDPGEKSLRSQVAELGGVASAEVGPDHAALGIAGYASDVGRYLRLLADAVLRPRHGERSFKARRDQLLDAIEDLEASDPEALSRVLMGDAFGAGHPYARPVIGRHASVAALGLEDVVAEQERVLVPGGATLLVVGDVRPRAVAAEAAAAFGRWRGRAGPPPGAPPAGARRAARSVGLLRRRPAATLLACASRPLEGVRAPDAVLEVLAAVLGQGARSRLAMALREERGLTYGAEAHLVRRRQARALLACSPLDAARAEEGLQAFREALESLRTRPPGPEEIDRARASRLAAIDASQEDAAACADAWEAALALGQGEPRPDAERRALEQVSAEDVRAAAVAALAPRALRWLVSGDPAAAARAVEANGLGVLTPLSLGR